MDKPEVPELKKPRVVRPWDLLNKNIERSSEEIKNERMEICRSCPFFIKITTQCSKCGCVMEAKTRLAEASCPVDKWGPV
jgi:hypothetical protein